MTENHSTDHLSDRLVTDGGIPPSTPGRVDKTTDDDGNIKTVRRTVSPDGVVTRDVDGEEIEMLRVPISSTREDREGDAFTESDLRDRAKQIREEQPMVFDDHGGGLFSPGYSARETIGGQMDAELAEDDDEHHTLYAYVNPDGTHNEGERMLKQVRDEKQPIKFSVGFRILQIADDLREDEQPERSSEVSGRLFTRTDIMESSRVGIPANPNAGVTHELAAKGGAGGMGGQPIIVADRSQLLEALGGNSNTSGFAAKNATQKVEGGCEADEECPEGEECVEGECVPEDDDEDSTSVEALRDELDALRADVDDLRDDDGDGDDDGESCEVDTDCPEGEVCVEGECVPEDDVDDPDGDDDGDTSYEALRAEIDALREEINSGTGTPDSKNTDATADAATPEHNADDESTDKQSESDEPDYMTNL